MAKAKPTPKTIDHALYWKLRSQLLIAEQMRAQMQAQLSEHQAIVQQTFRDAGLDPRHTYELNDADCSALLKVG